MGMGRTRSEPSVRFRPPGRRDILELGSLRAGSDERRRKTTATVAVTMLMMMLEVPDTAAPLRRVVRRVSDVGVIDNRCAASTLPSLALCIPDGASSSTACCQNLGFPPPLSPLYYLPHYSQPLPLVVRSQLGRWGLQAGWIELRFSSTRWLRTNVDGHAKNPPTYGPNRLYAGSRPKSADPPVVGLVRSVS